MTNELGCDHIYTYFRMKEVVAGYLTGETVVVIRHLAVEGEVLLQLSRVEEGVQLMMKAVVVVNSMLLLADLV